MLTWRSVTHITCVCAGRAPPPVALGVNLVRKQTCTASVIASCDFPRDDSDESFGEFARTFCTDLDLPPLPWADTVPAQNRARLEDQDCVGSMELPVVGGGESVCSAEMPVSTETVVHHIGVAVLSPTLFSIPPFLHPTPPSTPAEDEASRTAPSRDVRSSPHPLAVLRGALYTVSVNFIHLYVYTIIHLF